MTGIANYETGIMTTENVLAPSPSEIKEEMASFILSLGYIHPEEAPAGVANPRLEKRESAPNEVLYDTYLFPGSYRNASAVVITNCTNDVVIINFETTTSDSVLSRYFEVNNVHDRQNTKDFLVKHTR